MASKLKALQKPHQHEPLGTASSPSSFQECSTLTTWPDAMSIHEFSSHKCQKTAKKEGMILQKESSVNFGVDDTNAKAAEFGVSQSWSKVSCDTAHPIAGSEVPKQWSAICVKAWFHLVSFLFGGSTFQSTTTWTHSPFGALQRAILAMTTSSNRQKNSQREEHSDKH